LAPSWVVNSAPGCGKEDDGSTRKDQLCHQRRQSIKLSVGKTRFDHKVLTFDVTNLSETLAECPEHGLIRF
jgi:hypothetical protein